VATCCRQTSINRQQRHRHQTTSILALRGRRRFPVIVIPAHRCNRRQQLDSVSVTEWRQSLNKSPPQQQLDAPDCCQRLDTNWRQRAPCLRLEWASSGVPLAAPFKEPIHIGILGVKRGTQKTGALKMTDMNLQDMKMQDMQRQSRKLVQKR